MAAAQAQLPAAAAAARRQSSRLAAPTAPHARCEVPQLRRQQTLPPGRSLLCAAAAPEAAQPLSLPAGDAAAGQAALTSWVRRKQYDVVVSALRAAYVAPHA